MTQLIDIAIIVLAADATLVAVALVATRLVGRTFWSRRTIQLGVRTWRDVRREIILMVATVCAGCLVGIGTNYLVVSGITRATFGWPTALEFSLQLISYFIAFDFYLYWVHRLLHKPLLFRWVHHWHHCSRIPSPLTAFATHPVEAGANALFIPLAFSTVPINVIVVLWVTLQVQLHTVVLHCGREPFPHWWIFAWPMKWFATPLFHDAHHSSVAGNYGFYTTVWDSLFGTRNGSADQSIARFYERAKARIA